MGREPSLLATGAEIDEAGDPGGRYFLMSNRQGTPDGDAWWWLRRQIELELLDQELLLGMTKVRPSVAGKFTASICTAASLSSTARGVRPPASGLSRARSVTCRQ